MRDRTLILAGLASCLGLLTWPAWRTLAAPPSPPPDLARPANATECVAPTGYMRASHMVLLQDWREKVVRAGVRTYTTPAGRVVPMSLTGTCLRACHTDKAKFCDRCHDYANVKPTCWNCHVADPSTRSARSGQGSGRRIPEDTDQRLARDLPFSSQVRKFASSQVARRRP
jgi:hypothetical protein